MRFLFEDLVDVADGDQGGVLQLQREAARVLLPGGPKADSFPQRLLLAMKPAAFQNLRRLVRDRLQALAINKAVGPHRVTLGLILVGGSKPGQAPIVEGSAEDIVWFYVGHLVCRAGTSQIGVCPAPKSKRKPGGTDYCGRLFVRRGQAKQFCSDTCRSRVATQRARRPAQKKRRAR